MLTELLRRREVLTAELAGVTAAIAALDPLAPDEEDPTDETRAVPFTSGVALIRSVQLTEPAADSILLPGGQGCEMKRPPRVSEGGPLMDSDAQPAWLITFSPALSYPENCARCSTD